MHSVTLEAGPRSQIVPIDELSNRLDREIDYLERLRSQTPNAPASVEDKRAAPLLPQEIERELQFLRQLSAGLACGDPGPVWYDRVGFGTLLLTRDLTSGREEFHKIVMQRLNPMDLAQVSLTSDLGRALLGRRTTDEVETGRRSGGTRLRILTVKTLPERLRMPISRLSHQGRSAAGDLERT